MKGSGAVQGVRLLGLGGALAACARQLGEDELEAALTPPDPAPVVQEVVEGPYPAGPDCRRPLLSTWGENNGAVGYTYLDPAHGPTVRFLTSPTERLLLRMPCAPPGLRPLTPEEVAQRQLPAVPEGLEGMGPQPPPGTLWGAWREDPRLKHRFHPEYPDSLRAWIGEFHGAELQSTMVWLSVRQCEANACTGVLLDVPAGVRLGLGDPVWFSLEDLWPTSLVVAAPLGTPPPPELVARSRHPAMQNRLQDEPALRPNYDLPVRERLLPMSQYVEIGGQLGFVGLSDVGPVLVRNLGPSPRVDHLDWRPERMNPLSEADRLRLGLPVTPYSKRPHQPPPGLWGETWREDPALEPYFLPGQPDELQVAVVQVKDGQRKSLGSGVVMLISCTPTACEALMREPPPDSNLSPRHFVQVLRAEGLPPTVVDDGAPTKPWTH